jgi:amphi-Trp domain-containing protein
MGQETVLFKSEERKTSKEAANILRLIADKIDSGTITFKQDINEITLSLPKTLVLEIKVEKEENAKTRHSLEIELEWIEGAAEAGETTIL